MKFKSTLLTFCGLLGLTALTLFAHGYHLGIEDQVIYLPAIKKSLNPALYPHDATLFLAQSGAMFFPQMVAWSARLSHLPLDWVIFLWQQFSVFLFFAACLRISRKVFAAPRAHWAAVTMLAALFTLPVTDTALFIGDPYLHPRLPATALLLFMLAELLDRKFVRASFLLAAAALLHVQMAFYGAWLAIFFLLPARWLAPLRLSDREKLSAAALLFFPLRSLFEPATPAWYEAARTRWFHYLTRWHWYGWLGIFAPLAMLAWFSRIARARNLTMLRRLSLRLIAFGIFIFAAAAILTLPRAFERLTPYQPMRGYHLLYILLFLFIGGLLAEFVLKARPLRWIALFVPLCLLMFYVQRQIMPASPHIEWPGVAAQNPWLQAFGWIKQNTPTGAYFALDSHYTKLPGEDVHGFRAFAERSMMADYEKDSGVALLFPAIAPRWQREAHARDGWQNFSAADLRRLHDQFGVDWALLLRSQRAAAELDCPYRNSLLVVCSIE